MILPEWKRIAGIQVQGDGCIGCVWAAIDPDTDTIHLYDACVYRREVLAVIGEGLNARGRWIPVVWSDKDMADKLLEYGCNMIPEEYKETDASAEVISRDVWERMRSGRFKVDKRLGEWLEEYKTFNREGQKVPKDTHPLMTATRFIVGMRSYARRQGPKRGVTVNFPKVAIL